MSGQSLNVYLGNLASWFLRSWLNTRLGPDAGPSFKACDLGVTDVIFDVTAAVVFTDAAEVTGGVAEMPSPKASSLPPIMSVCAALSGKAEAIMSCLTSRGLKSIKC